MQLFVEVWKVCNISHEGVLSMTPNWRLPIDNRLLRVAITTCATHMLALIYTQHPVCLKCASIYFKNIRTNVCLQKRNTH